MIDVLDVHGVHLINGGEMPAISNVVLHPLGQSGGKVTVRVTGTISFSSAEVKAAARYAVSVTLRGSDAGEVSTPTLNIPPGVLAVLPLSAAPFSALLQASATPFNIDTGVQELSRNLLDEDQGFEKVKPGVVLKPPPGPSIPQLLLKLRDDEIYARVELIPEFQGAAVETPAQTLVHS